MRTVLALLVVSCLAFAQRNKTPAKAEPSPWDLVFSDEFNGAELDLAKWVPHAPDAHVREPAPGVIEVSGGQMHVIARSPAGAMATTFGTFARTYGRFEIRVRIPAGAGLRSRFRLLPLSLGLPEIDVFEADSAAPSKVYFGNHWGTEQTERSFGDSFAAPDLSAAFHVIAIEWEPDRIAWFVDGKKRFESIEGVPRQPMFLAIDLAKGEGSLDIDYIRAYQRR